MEAEEQKNKELITFRKTRKAFSIEYLCGLFLLGLFLFLSLKGTNLLGLRYIIGSVALIAFASAEFSRFLTRYKIMEDKLVIVHGILKHKKKNVYFHPLGFVPDINIKQGRIQRLLNYGTVYVESGGNQLEVKDVNNPQRILEILESRIDRNRRV